MGSLQAAPVQDELVAQEYYKAFQGAALGGKIESGPVRRRAGLPSPQTSVAFVMGELRVE